MPAQQRTGKSWFTGSADAIYQSLNLIRDDEPDYVVVFGADNIYRMDVDAMLQSHISSGAECTIAGIRVPRSEASAFGIIDADSDGKMNRFLEKPADPPGLPDSPDESFASMGNYIFNAKSFVECLTRDAVDPTSKHDMGGDVVPYYVNKGTAWVYDFTKNDVPGSTDKDRNYWRDVGTIDAYWDANIDLTATDPLLNLYDTNWPIWTYQPQLPPAKFVHNQDDRRGVAVESLVSGGCIISGAVFRSVLFSSVRVHSYSAVSWSVLLPGVQVGRHARLTRVVVDRDCVVPDGMVIGEDAAADAEHFYRTESGITLVTREMLRRL